VRRCTPRIFIWTGNLKQNLPPGNHRAMRTAQTEVMGPAPPLKRSSTTLAGGGGKGGGGCERCTDTAPGCATIPLKSTTEPESKVALISTATGAAPWPSRGLPLGESSGLALVDGEEGIGGDDVHEADVAYASGAGGEGGETKDARK
jgi:hypothetical protein